MYTLIATKSPEICLSIFDSKGNEVDNGLSIDDLNYKISCLIYDFELFMEINKINKKYISDDCKFVLKSALYLPPPQANEALSGFGLNRLLLRAYKLECEQQKKLLSLYDLVNQ